MARQQRDLAKERYWQQHLTRWRSSGLRVRDYCRAEKLSEASFYAWRRILAERRLHGQPPQPAATVNRREGAAPSAFVPVRLVEEPPRDAALEIVLRGGRVVRVAPGFTAESLRAVVAVLEGLPC
jgi:hypothetical protein